MNIKRRFGEQVDRNTIAMSTQMNTPPLPKRKTGVRVTAYHITSPVVLSTHNIGRGGGVTRTFRMFQLSQMKRMKEYDEIPFPKSHLPPDDNVKEFEHYLGINTASTKNLNKRSNLFKKLEIQKTYTHQRDGIVYLNAYEYERRVLDEMNAKRGLTPRKQQIQVRSRHMTYDGYY